jgi:hypothetical protein
LVKNSSEEQPLTDQHSPVDAVLDVLVFAPVGIVITAAEELPKLAAKGRAQVIGRVSVARLVGQFAVAQGRKELEKRLGGQVGPAGPPPAATPSGTSPPASPGATDEPPGDRTYDEMLGVQPGEAEAGGGFLDEPDPPADRPLTEYMRGPRGDDSQDALSGEGASGSNHNVAPAPAGARTRRAGTSARVDRPSTNGAGGPTHLGIPGYDSLSASQVVQRLAGLSSDELEAVGAYELANRGRRTVLTRVRQLQGS